MGFDRGSSNYVYKYRRTWGERRGLSASEFSDYNNSVEREAHIQLTNHSKLPKNLLRSFEKHIQDIETGFAKQYRDRLEEKNEQLTHAIGQLKQCQEEKYQAQENLQLSNKERDQWQQQHDDLFKTHNQLAEAKRLADQQIKAQQDLLKETKENYETRISELKTSHETRMNRYQQETKILKDEFNAEKNQWLEHQEKQRHAFIAKIDHLNEQLKKQSKQQEDQAKATQKVQDDYDALKREHKTQSQQLTFETKAKENLAKMNRQQQAEHADLRVEQRLLKAQLQNMTEQNKTLQQQSKEAGEKRAAAETELRVLKAIKTRRKKG